MRLMPLLLPAVKISTLLVQASALLFQQGPLMSPDLTPPDDGSPVRVEAGILLLDLMSVDGSDQSFRADAVVRLVWHDPRLADPNARGSRFAPSGQVWYPSVEIVNRRAIERTLPEQVRIDPDGTVTYAQRFVGSFSSPMDLREFPLDRQSFSIRMAVGRVDSNVDIVPVPFEGGAARSEQLSVSDWHMGEATIELRPVQLTPQIQLVGLALTMEGKRAIRYYIVQVILPLMMIVTMAWTVFWIDPGVIPTRIGTVVTTMLTLIAYRFALASLVPRLPYLTRLDWFMLGSTSLILSTLLVVAASAYLKSQGNDAAVARIDRFGRVGFAAVAIVVWTLPWLL